MKNAPDTRRADDDLVIAREIHRDPLRPEMTLLAKPQDLLDHLRIGLGGLMVRRARPIIPLCVKSSETVTFS